MLRIENLSVAYADTMVVRDVNLEVAQGELVAILGPSGAGKTTLLRAVAGLVTPGTGTVHWQGRDITDVPPHRRGFGLMFQDYALFPHRTVGGNVAFGLRMRGDDPAAIDRRVRQVLDWVNLPGSESRNVAKLSGGEQQRVALARALAPEPQLLMLDEPVGSLDRVLRERLVEELRDVLAEQGISALYVTHDQDEANTLADQIVIMRDGTVVQSGTPRQLWDSPASAWVADFLDLGTRVEHMAGITDVPSVIRHQAVSIGGPIPALVTAVSFQRGKSVVRTITEDGHALNVSTSDLPPRPGERIGLTIDPAGVIHFR